MAPKHPSPKGKFSEKTENVVQILTSISDDKIANDAKKKLQNIANQQFKEYHAESKHIPQNNKEENYKLHQCEKCKKKFGSKFGLKKHPCPNNFGNDDSDNFRKVNRKNYGASLNVSQRQKRRSLKDVNKCLKCLKSQDVNELGLCSKV